MSTKKIDRAVHGPSWAEVILGAALSLVLGVVLGAALLIVRPIAAVRELPKEADRDPNIVYYVEGSRETAKARQALTKRKSFVEGRSVDVTEDEINSLVAAANPAPAGAAAAPKAPEKKAGEKKAGEKAAEKAVAAANDMLATGTPNVRIRENVVQVGVPVTLGLMGLEHKVVAHARGTFVKQGDVFVYEPTVLYLGSCNVQRVPFVSGLVRKMFLAASPVPEDIATAWRKLANVTVEGSTLKLAMP